MEFFQKYKKIFLIILFVFTVFFLGYLLYYVFFRTPEPVITPTTPATTTPGGLPIAPKGPGQIVEPEITEPLPTEITTPPTQTASPVAKGGLTKTSALTNTETSGAALSSDGNSVQYYNKNDGKFYRITKDGQITSLTNKVFYEVETIVWSPDREKAVLEYPDGANIVYNFKTGQQVTLPSHWKEFDFSPDSEKIVTKSIGLDTSNRWLAISNADGTNMRAIEALGENEDIVYPSWSPNNQIIAMYKKGVNFDDQEIFFVGLNGENFKSTIVHGRGFEYEWSPSGDRLLYSVYSSDNDMKPMLWIVGAQGEQIGSDRKSLKVNTWANKCTFADSRYIYCGVPKQLEEGAGIFKEMALNTTDNLYKIDTQTGLKSLVAVPNGDYNMSNLIISEDKTTLFFTDKKDNRIYEINLK